MTEPNAGTFVLCGGGYSPGLLYLDLSRVTMPGGDVEDFRVETANTAM